MKIKWHKFWFTFHEKLIPMVLSFNSIYWAFHHMDRRLEHGIWWAYHSGLMDEEQVIDFFENHFRLGDEIIS